MNWTDPAAIGYPALFGGVLLGSIVPIVPTGAVVGAAAAVATTTGHLSLPLVIVLATLGAYVGDVVTFGDPAASAAKPRSAGSAAASPPNGWRRRATQFARRGWQLVVIGRLVPAGRIPVLLAAAALGYPWRRLLPAAFGACVLWAGAYALLGVVSGGIFDSPLVATLLATVLVLLVTVLANLVARVARARPKERSVTTSAPKGRLLRGGRAVARVLLVWAAVTGALRLLDVCCPASDDALVAADGVRAAARPARRRRLAAGHADRLAAGVLHLRPLRVPAARRRDARPCSARSPASSSSASGPR